MAGRTIGTMLRDLRISRGMTQEALSQHMFVPKSTISAYENDKIDISASVLRELAAALGVTPGYFFDTEDRTEEAKEVEHIISVIRGIKNGNILRVLMEQVKSLATLDGKVQ